MPDPTADDAIKEAYAMAPKGVVTYHTLEIWHPEFIDEAGDPAPARVVLGNKDIVATLEADAPLDPGEAVVFRAVQFKLTLAPIELSPAPELEGALAAVAIDIVKNLDRAVSDSNKIVLRYRPYLSTDLSTPRMLPPPTYDLSQAIAAGGTQMKFRARNGIDLRGNFPKLLYTAAGFPGLVGR